MCHDSGRPGALQYLKYIVYTQGMKVESVDGERLTASFICMLHRPGVSCALHITCSDVLSMTQTSSVFLLLYSSRIIREFWGLPRSRNTRPEAQVCLTDPVQKGLMSDGEWLRARAYKLVSMESILVDVGCACI